MKDLALKDTGWVTAVVVPTWASANGILIRRVGKWAMVRGQLSTMGTTGTPAVLLPVGFRPSDVWNFPQSTGSATAPAAVVIRPTGSIDPFFSAGTKIDLAMTWLVEA